VVKVAGRRGRASCHRRPELVESPQVSSGVEMGRGYPLTHSSIGMVKSMSTMKIILLPSTTFIGGFYQRQVEVEV